MPAKTGIVLLAAAKDIWLPADASGRAGYFA